jgi:thymidylate synthase
MNNLDKQYTALLQDILDNGTTKQDRTGTGTLSVFGRQIRHKMSEGFPLLTTKKMPFRVIATELMWFLRGDTNIKYLVDNDCHIWDGDAYKNYERRWETEGKFLSPPVNKFTKEEFINEIKTNPMVAKELGDLGPIYGKQWRSWTKYEQNTKVSGTYDEAVVDQIANSIHLLKTDPDSRRNKVNSWNVGELDQMTLPPCHTDFQFYTRELREIERYVMLVNLTNRPLFFLDKGDGDVKMREFMEECDKLNIPTRAISLQWSQRSVDSFLGLPFNIASYGLLLEIIAKEVNMVPDELIGNLGDTHLYLNHIEQAKEQIGRELSQTARYNLLTKQMTKLRAIRDEDYIKYNIPTRTREPFPLPKLMICGDMRRTDGFTVPFDELDHGLLKLIDYQSHPTIKAPLSN